MTGWLVGLSLGSALASPAYAAVKPVRVSITDEKDGCEHDVDKRGERLKKRQDSLGWRVSNKCDDAQKVLICVYPENPFDACTSTPAGLDIGKEFTVGSGRTAVLNCVADDPGRYVKQVRVGAEVPSSGCPDEPEKEIKVYDNIILLHSLDIVIE